VDNQQQSRTQRTRKRILWTVGIVGILAAILGGACIFIRFAYVREWKWTGLVKDPDFHKRTLWEWLNLLIVPAVLALVGYFFTRSENRRTQEDADRQRRLDREIADDRRQDDTLQAYLDGMSQLLTDENRPLHRTQSGDSLRTVARARTLTVLRRLGSGRKRNVLEFLFESGLIYKEHTLLNKLDLVERRDNIVSLQQADLKNADLSEADLRGAHLSGAILIDADLSGAHLSGAILRGTDLLLADLRGADLRGADLMNADLMNADLREADLIEAYYLRRADLRGANLREADLINADLRWAFLDRANLSEAYLREADLSGAHLSGAELIDVDLASADLSGAYLSRADLRGAYLGGADLSGANLKEARGWTEEQLKAASSLEGATMPNGQKYEDWLKDREGRKQDGENG
jgi:uncharacterized protein YjbI with pentapeptide repeats/flagellar basal body-associated protein FliL